MNESIADIYDSLQEIAWQFGDHGISGECCEDLSFVEYMALRKIQEHPDYAIQEMGRALNVTKSGATRIVDRLESKGYVTRKNSPLDGRICCVSSTVSGTEAIAKVAAKYLAYLEDVLREMAPQKAENIKNTLRMLVRAVQEGKPFDPKATTHMKGTGS